MMILDLDRRSILKLALVLVMYVTTYPRLMYLLKDLEK